jgi:hypothetical protein
MRRFGAATQVGEAGTLRTESSCEKLDFGMEPGKLSICKHLMSLNIPQYQHG